VLRLNQTTIAAFLHFKNPTQYSIITATITIAAMQPKIIRRFALSLDTKWLQTLQLVALHVTFAPQQRQRKIFKFT